MFARISFIALLLVIKRIRADTINYCDPKLCKYQGGVHLACNADPNEFSDQCPQDREVVNLTQVDINQILDLHNKFRSQIARGLISGFSSASRMPTVKWNNELADLAELHTRDCSMDHDSCHNTDTFIFSGQNIGLMGNNIRFADKETMIRTIIESWTNEYKTSNQSTIDSCCSS